MPTSFKEFRAKKVGSELKESKRLNVNLKAVIEKALEEIIRRKARLLKSWVSAVLEAMKNLTVEAWVKAVRETRQES